MLGGTFDRRILLSRRRFNTSLIIWPVNTSVVTNTYWSDVRFSDERISLMQGMITSLKNLRDSFLFE